MSERRKLLLLGLTGFNLILLNYTLIRQTTLAFRDLETSALIMALAYFGGISVGYLRSDKLPEPWLQTLLPLFLIFQMILATGIQIFVFYLEEISGPTLAYVIIFLAVAVGSTSLYSIFLPRLIQPVGAASPDPHRTRRYYTAEIVGSLVGLISLPLWAPGGLVAVYAVYFLSFLALAWMLHLRRTLLIIMSGYVILFLILFDPLDKAVSAAYYQRFYSGRGIQRVIFTRYSPYHKIEILEGRGGNRYLLLNSHWQFGPGSHENYSYFIAEYPARLLNKPTVALLGCGSMSTVGRMGDYVKSIQIVDLDTAVFETSRTYFPQYNRLAQLHNWTFISDDAKHFLGSTPQQFDLIIDDIPPAKTRQVALTYTREFFELVRARLTPKGIYSLPTLTPLNSRSDYGRRMLATLAAVFDRVYVLNDRDAAYCFAGGRDVRWDRKTLEDAIHHPHKKEIVIWLPDEVRQRMRGVKIITINNMADLIFD